MGASTAAQLVNYGQALIVDISRFGQLQSHLRCAIGVSEPQNECHLPHFNRKGGHVRFNAVIRRNSDKEVFDYWESSVLDRDKTANLSHDLEQGNRTNIRALPTHVAPRDDLHTILIRGIIVVWDETGCLELLWG